MERSDSFDSDSVELMTPLTTLTLDFHKVISALTSPKAMPIAVAYKSFHSGAKVQRHGTEAENIIRHLFSSPLLDVRCLFILFLFIYHLIFNTSTWNNR